MKRNVHKGRGQLVVLEGADGVGKTTLATALVATLGKMGKKSLVFSFPGSDAGTLGSHVYQVHHNPQEFGITMMTAASKQTLHIAAHVDVIERRILPSLSDDVVVILDRYWWSTWVHGRVEGVPSDVLDALVNVERQVWRGIRPNIVVFMRRTEPMDREVNLAEWQEIQHQYTDLAMREARNMPILFLDDSSSVGHSCAAVLDALLGPNPTKDMARQQTLIDFTEESRCSVAPIVLKHLAPLTATAVYDTYWKFAAERQEIFFRRLEGRPPPWTKDPILQRFKFTNAYRASDRVSQFLIRHVIYGQELSAEPEEVFFRIILFKLFNKIDTWRLIESSVGRISYSKYSFERYDEVLTSAMARGERIYSGAYIMPSGGRVLGSTSKHRNHLRLLEWMMEDGAPRKILGAKTMHQVFDILLTYPTIGEFLAYQYAIDINYSELTNFSEYDFVVPGPGALDGIRKCFLDFGGLNEPELIRFVADQQNREFERLGLRFKSLWGRPLQLIDCQNLFCEVDKYSRVHHPEVAGISGRTRIKQKFSCSLEPISYWYPPKWGINHSVSDTVPRRTESSKGRANDF